MFGRPDGCIDQLTTVERAAIVTLHGIGWTGRDIAQELHCNEHTVTLWLHRWNETRCLDDAERSGRPRKLSEEAEDILMVYSNTHDAALPRDLVRELQLPVSARTVRRRLNEYDLITYVRRREVELSAGDLKRRLAWAQGYSHWTEADWRRVLWSDHTLFTLDYQTREYVVCQRGHAGDAEHLHSVPRLQGAVWLWGCFCVDGLGHAELYDGTLDAAWYKQLLSLNLTKSAHTFWPSGQWFFQQDNASPHTAGATSVWFHNNGIDVIDFPPYSSDLSPIENLWSDLKSRVYAHHPQTMKELEGWIRYEWEETKLDFCKHACLDLPKRLQLVIANNGHKIRR
jgi:transposase